MKSVEIIIWVLKWLWRHQIPMATRGYKWGFQMPVQLFKSCIEFLFGHSGLMLSVGKDEMSIECAKN